MAGRGALIAIAVLAASPGAHTLVSPGIPRADTAARFSRRALVARIAAPVVVSALLEPLSAPQPARAADVAQAGGFSDLPPQSVRAFKQYGAALQYAGDYLLFELHDAVLDESKWIDIEDLMRSSSANGQGQPSAFGRLVLIPMQQISLAFPPDVSDELAERKNDVEKALAAIVRVTRNTNAAVSTGASSEQIRDAEAAWQEARLGLNKFYALVDVAIGRSVMQPIPASEKDGYVRTRARYIKYKKGLAVCQNRGGANLAGVWGGLMVYGTAVDPCGDMATVEAYLSN
jgi:hypothetical protein